MGSFSTITASLLLLLLLAFQLPGQAGANPVYNAVSNTDLMELKNLLDHLEEKTASEDEVVPPQGVSEQNDEAGVVLSSLPEVPSWTGRATQSPETGVPSGGAPGTPDRSALLKSKLRALLAAPRSLRRSSCFGGRIDRIGAQSGLGCNSFRASPESQGNAISRSYSL
ncbi:LOW QUALITY PROTEIN: natriuretic peptides A [Ctenodactylus gundi]